MHLSSIINRYVIKEMIPIFFLNLGFFMFVFLMSQILDVMHMVVNYNAGLISVLFMIVYHIPYFLIFIIPLSAMISVLLTFLRMSADNEIVALKSGGVNIYQLIVPVFVFCFSASLLTAAMTMYGLPWGKKSFQKVVADVAASGIDIGLKERTFNDSFENVMLYVTKIDVKTKTLIDVFIEDQRNEDMVSTVVAPKGKLFSDPDNKIFQLKLYNGVINQVSLKNRVANTLRFDTYDINLDMKQRMAALTARSTDEKAMWLSELREFIRKSPKNSDDYYEALLEFHRKFTMPVACLVLGLLAFPLGLQSREAKKSMGLGLGLFFFLLFYLLFSAGKVYGETGTVPPWIGMWAPIAIMGGIAAYHLVRAGKEKPFRFSFLPRQIRELLTHY
ncbi:MAG: LPS export ABC transporter permease LptF [Desulfobacterales bacterium]